ncbi:MAG: HAMP domain-containing histidine kinase [Clostridiales bacterium]|nr:HAMP domain-containing histidine kinase [Candidatus Cacconaster stercorequi]
MKNRLKVRGLRQRWMISSVAPVILLLVLIAAAVCAGIVSSYYSSAQSTLETKAKTGADYFNTYVMSNYSEYYRSAMLYTANFDAVDHIELQFLNSSGRIETASSGLTAGASPDTPEIQRALNSGELTAYSGRDPSTNESILAVSAPLKFNNSIVGVMRYVASTRNLDRQALVTVLIIAAITLLIIALLIISNLIFINNVVAPVAEVTEAAKRISGGSYGIQIPNKYSDEMGELVDNINDMSLKISQSEKMQTEFISSVSHELRTPLTAINGWGETLLGDDSGDIRQLRRGLRIILKESRRLANMVEELLEFSKMQDGRFTLQVEEMDLQAELEDAIYTYRELFKQDGITLEYEEAGELYTDPISGDPERLKQVLCNVLDNAAKHGGSGKRIITSLKQEEDDYVIRIRDFGPGIPEAELPYVKQKFYKGSSKARGSGIGLAVCDEIINLHGGQFDIGNAEDGGAIVTIRLPMEHRTEE